MTFVHIIIASIITYFAILIGSLFCILPGIYLAGRLNFFFLYLLDHKEATCIDALKASWSMTKNNGLTLFLLLIVLYLIAILGVLCCFVGVLVSLLIVYFAMVVCYLTLTNKEE